MNYETKIEQKDKLLKVNDLTINLQNQSIPVVDGISFEINKGQTLCLVGESGCGKSLTALSLMGLLPFPAVQQTGGTSKFLVHDLFSMSKSAMRNIRGNDLAMIFQEPMTSLNPVHRIGDQITEMIVHHQRVSRLKAKKQAIDLLDMVKIPSAWERYNNYPHELSGGMRQRVMIAIAMANSPKLLIADEPTTALDVTVQLEILALIKELQKETETAVLFITHDFGVVANIADSVAVMYGGHIVEYGSVTRIFRSPQHPYTLGLMNAMPDITRPKAVLPAIAGIVPPVHEMPAGCRFFSRCPFADEKCKALKPPAVQREPDHRVNCFNTPIEDVFSVVL